MRELTNDTGLVLALIEDYEAAPLTEQDRAMVEYAVQLTQEPGSVMEDDVDRLKDEGLSDEEILCIAQTVAYFNFKNRLSAGLGVELEKRWYDDGPWKAIVDSTLHRTSM